MFEQPFMMAWDSINRGGVISWDYEDDFTTDKMTYVSTGFAYDGTGDEQDWTMPNGLTADQSYVDMLASTISDTLWELRTKLAIGTYSANTAPNIKQNWIGIFSTTSSMATAQDGIFFDYGSASSASVVKIGNVDGATPNTNLGDSLTSAISASTLWYIALLRQSATLTKVSLSSTDSYTEDLEIKTKAVASTTSALRYLQHSGRTGEPDGTITGTFDDVLFANGVNYL